MVKSTYFYNNFITNPGKKVTEKKVPEKRSPRKKVTGKKSLQKKGPPEKRSPEKWTRYTRSPQFGVCRIVGWALSILWGVWSHRVGSIDKINKIVQLPSVNSLVISSTENAFFGIFITGGDHFSGNFFREDFFSWVHLCRDFFPGEFWSANFLFWDFFSEYPSQHYTQDRFTFNIVGAFFAVVTTRSWISTAVQIISRVHEPCNISLKL